MGTVIRVPPCLYFVTAATTITATNLDLGCLFWAYYRFHIYFVVSLSLCHPVWLTAPSRLVSNGIVGKLELPGTAVIPKSQPSRQLLPICPRRQRVRPIFIPPSARRPAQSHPQ